MKVRLPDVRARLMAFSDAHTAAFDFERAVMAIGALATAYISELTSSSGGEYPTSAREVEILKVQECLSALEEKFRIAGIALEGWELALDSLTPKITNGIHQNAGLPASRMLSQFEPEPESPATFPAVTASRKVADAIHATQEAVDALFTSMAFAAIHKVADQSERNLLPQCQDLSGLVEIALYRWDYFVSLGIRVQKSKTGKWGGNLKNLAGDEKIMQVAISTQKRDPSITREDLAELIEKMDGVSVQRSSIRQKLTEWSRAGVLKPFRAKGGRPPKSNQPGKRHMKKTKMK